MLIDAAHPEETRVVVLRGSRVEEFDFESASRKQLRGNIYLAKVTRVEPSLQAAFVDYGGNRHGFLAFSEIHPDYYQIPIADRQALIEEEERAIAEAEATQAESDDNAAADSEEDAPDEVADDGDDEALEADDDAADVDESAAPAREPGAASADAEESGGESSRAPQALAEASRDPVVSEPPAGEPTAAETAPPVAASSGDAAPAGDPAIAAEPSSAVEAEVGSRDETAAAPAPSAEPVEGEARSDSASEPPLVTAEPAFGGERNGVSAASGGGSEDEAISAAVEVVSDDRVESVGAEDALEELPERRRPRIRQYKIQEVIKRRQVLLVQVVKEERGNKGAALTTYLSLAGRYCVLMPNTARGGGISRKITSPADRKRLKQLAADLEVPEGMGVILRTAGATRTKAEVKRDFEYLLRLWENVRELTLRSTAPTLVYEEGSLIKRSIRDLYNKDIDEILVAGEDAYREAKDFMRMLMPSHAKNVQPYRDRQPLFARSGIEAQLDAMFSPQVTLRSGGYLVINQTEALVSIDVNSGRSTREHNIEDTAYQTNLEAAEEIARQLRLRDLAGLIVIDFIDMEEKRNNRAVERRLKEALKNDRARIQVGRISHFGLLEMSRQRIRTGVLESTTTICPICQGSGHIRAPASVALHVLRSLEDQFLRGVTHHIAVRTRTPVALYILNQKRAHLSELEQRFGLSITVLADEAIANGAHFAVERGEPIEHRPPPPTTVQPDSVQPRFDEPEVEVPTLAAEEEPDEAFEEQEREDEENPPRAEREDGGGGRRRRRRRRHRGEEVGVQSSPQAAAAGPEDDEGEEDDLAEDGGDRGGENATAADGDNHGRKRRRGRRGGRRGRRGRERPFDEAPADAGVPPAEMMPDSVFPSGNGHQPSLAAEPAAETGAADGDRKEEANREPAAAANHAEELQAPAETGEYRPQPPHEPEPAMTRPEEAPETTVEEAVSPLPEPPHVEEEEPNRPKRGGWWQRRSFF
jgi:ribonuclease E